MLIQKLRPMTWSDYKKLSAAQHENYYKEIKEKYRVNDDRIAAMLGVSRRKMEDLHRAEGVKAIKTVESPDSVKKWETFCDQGGFPCTVQQWNAMAQRALDAERELRQLTEQCKILQLKEEKILTNCGNMRQAERAMAAYARTIGDPVLPVLISELRQGIDTIEHNLSDPVQEKNK